MIGYGAEDSHFVLELTYNYGVGSYQLGNDFQVHVSVYVHPVVSYNSFGDFLSIKIILENGCVLKVCEIAH